MTWRVGQKVYVVYYAAHCRRPKREDKIVKVGTKWAYLSTDERFEKETGKLDGRGYSAPGSIWESQAAYEAHVERLEKWAELKKALDIWPPDDVTIQDIADAAACLKLELPK